MLFLAGPAFWLTGVPVSLAFAASRAMLSFALGASLVLAALVQTIPSPRAGAVVIATLVALAAGRQFLWANSFRLDWEAHRSFFWQLNWRAPGIRPGTTILTNEELAYYADNSLGAALNWIYAPSNRSGSVDYALFFPTNRLGGSLPAIGPEVPISYDYLAGQFEGNTSASMSFYFDPPGCLRLLDPEIDPYNQSIPAEDLLREAAAFSSSTFVVLGVPVVLPAVYGPEPAHGWCYHFQRADLARQAGNWAQVARLGAQASTLPDHPNDPVERFVFIEGFAHMGEWEAAGEQSLLAYAVSKPVVGPLLCRLWDRIDRETAPDSRQAASVAEMRSILDCR
jgi:hypothetical protein